jgi:hypothetical protein
MDLPEITEVKRLTVRPGDRLVVRFAESLDMAAADAVKAQVRAAAGIEGVRVIVLDGGADLEVLAPGGGG